MLKANSATRDIPVVLLTATAGLAERIEGLRAGAADYVLKPFHVPEVMEKIHIQLALAQDRKSSNSSEHRRSTGANAADRTLLRSASQIILERLENPPGAEELSVSLGVSKRRIAAVFKSCLGMTLFEFTRRERMHEAARLLSCTNLSVSEIAAQVGYSSTANFSTAFREFWGTPPSVFRQAGETGSGSRSIAEVLRRERTIASD